jgi:hypothetical protein
MFMRLRLELMITLLLVALIAGFGQAPSDNEPHTTAQRISQVSKTLAVPAKNGSVQKLTVTMEDWSIPEDNTEFDLPAGVSAIMTVLNGRVSVVVDGVSKEYSTGNYWSAPAGTHMTISIQAPARGATVRTIIAVPAK